VCRRLASLAAYQEGQASILSGEIAKDRNTIEGLIATSGLGFQRACPFSRPVDGSVHGRYYADQARAFAVR
jgi:hypothetical protein